MLQDIRTIPTNFSATVLPCAFDAMQQPDPAPTPTLPRGRLPLPGSGQGPLLLAMFVFLVTLVVSLVVFRSSRRWVYYAGER